MEGKTLLYGSELLTAEEERIRADLLEIAQTMLNNGARPVPLMAAFMVMGRELQNPQDVGLTWERGGQGYLGLFPVKSA